MTEDYTEAVKWYRKDIPSEFGYTELRLGYCYVHGHGVPQDYSEAAHWWREALNSDSEDCVGEAQYNLGIMYVNGHGVPQDYLQAHMWFNLSASNSTYLDKEGNRFQSGEDQERRTKARNEAASKMTPDQIAEAQRLAREWKPKPRDQTSWSLTWDERVGSKLPLKGFPSGDV